MASQDKLSRPSKSLHSFVLDWSHGNQFCIDRSQAKLNIALQQIIYHICYLVIAKVIVMTLGIWVSLTVTMSLLSLVFMM